jgi:Skp family chaperone for outer membrane proteins
VELTLNLKITEMKKLITFLLAVILSLTILPVRSYASAKAAPTVLVIAKPDETTSEAAEAKALLSRLDEIKTMDKTKLKASDKKNLRKEVRSIKRELKDISGGVYISAGALIVILILLILLT